MDVGQLDKLMAIDAGSSASKETSRVKFSHKNQQQALRFNLIYNYIDGLNWRLKKGKNFAKDRSLYFAPLQIPVDF